MKLKFLDLSGKLHPYEEVFREVTRITSDLEVHFFVVGAIARDLIMGLGYGIESKRLTTDVDCGIQLASWQEFERVKNALIQTQQFQAMANYLDAGNFDRLLGEEADNADLLNDDFDHYLTGARLLGRDVGGILTERSYEPVTKILETQTGEQNQYPLVQGMLENFHGEFEKGLEMLEAFKGGIVDVKG
jgi:predicted nucleotidyltransferase